MEAVNNQATINILNSIKDTLDKVKFRNLKPNPVVDDTPVNNE
jgi:hypothetical protein